MPTTALSEIATRVEVEPPTCELLEGIACALGWLQHDKAPLFWRPREGHDWIKLPPWLSSIDAAASLMPEGWRVSVDQYRDVWKCIAVKGLPIAFSLVGCAKTESQARTAAALRALQAEATNPAQS